MSQSILTFQLPTTIKKKLQTKVRKTSLTLSEYLRELINQDLGLDKSKNPWLELADTFSVKEAEETLKEIKKSRKNRNDDYWANLNKQVSVKK